MLSTFRKIWDFADLERKNISVSVVISFLFAIFSMFEIAAIYYVILGVLDNSADAALAWSAVGILLISILGKSITKYFSQLMQCHAGYFMVAQKRIHIADKIKRLPMGYFNQNSLGKITGITTSVMEVVEILSARILVLILSGFINAIVFGLLVVLFDWRMGLIVVLTSSCYLIISSFVEKASARLAPHREKSQTAMVETVLEYIRGMGVVKSFNLSGKGDKAVKDALEYNCKSNLNIEKMFLPYLISQGIVINIGSVLIALSSVYFYLSGTMSLINAIMMIIVSFLVFANIQTAGSGLTLLRIVSSGIDEVVGIDAIAELDQEGREIVPENYDIEIDNISFSYENRNILKDISILLPQNTTTAIVGPSGSGKTTLCMLIARFWDVKEGGISIGGVDIRQYSLESLMRQISVVFQDVYLFADTIENNIKFGSPSASREQVIKAAKDASCHEFIIALKDGYDTVIGEGGNTLSGGEKQRISIARALLKDAPIVILDEATANVDPENEDKLQNAIEALTHDKTIIMIAHRLKTVRNADKIVVMSEGRIVQEGRHDELIKQNGTYKDFVERRELSANWNLGYSD